MWHRSADAFEMESLGGVVVCLVLMNEILIIMSDQGQMCIDGFGMQRLVSEFLDVG